MLSWSLQNTVTHGRQSVVWRPSRCVRSSQLWQSHVPALQYPHWAPLMFPVFRTVLLDNKDKKKSSLPKSQVVRKPVIGSSSSGGGSRERGAGAGSGAGQSSTYSGLGPGRGAGHHSPSPARPPARPSPHNQQSQNSHERKEKYPSALKSGSSCSSNSKQPVNLEVMKKPLRSVLVKHLLYRDCWCCKDE